VSLWLIDYLAQFFQYVLVNFYLLSILISEGSFAYSFKPITEFQFKLSNLVLMMLKFLLYKVQIRIFLIIKHRATMFFDWRNLHSSFVLLFLILGLLLIKAVSKGELIVALNLLDNRCLDLMLLSLGLIGGLGLIILLYLLIGSSCSSIFAC
jgi:hypothetical protein